MTDTVTLTFQAESASEQVVQSEVPRELGNVHLIEEVGRGGMGVVWRGVDRFLNRHVAVKLMRKGRLGGDPVSRQQFIEGARAAAAVKHASVVQMYHADELEDVIYIVMEFVDGCTLAEVLAQQKRFEPKLAALLIARILEALVSIHDSQVIHRDLKPSNVIFDSRGNLQVSDFGLSHHWRGSSDEGSIASGTPPYMAPEAFGGDASFQSDIYALGIMYYELLTGRRPFVAESVDDYHRAHANFPLPEEPICRLGLSDDVCDILMRATNKKKIFRYKTAAHMLNALTDAYPRLLLDMTLDHRLRERVLVSLGGEEKKSSEQADEATPTGTYFDLLSQRAEAKRKRKGK